jgi:hypothetical protein
VAASAILLYAIVTMWLVVPARANDSTIPCDKPPDKGSRVAVHPGTQVSTAQDYQEGTCTFSINGAVATSPPAQQVIAALNMFRDPSRLLLREPEMGQSAVAALLAAPAPVTEIPKDLTKILRDVGPQLERCLATFFGKNDLPTESSGDGAFSCRGIGPYGNAESKAEMLRTTGVAVGVPTLVIAVKWQQGRFKSVAYLPIAMVGQPALQEQ